MMSNNKILTVSYGTFSCTLEGFEDSFGTMKVIAEYFRDLAQDDRYFGAEPPQPDAEMLARIAEREIARRVEGHSQDGKVVLRASAHAASPAPLAPVATPVAAPTDASPQTAPIAPTQTAPAPQMEIAPPATATSTDALIAGAVAGAAAMNAAPAHAEDTEPEATNADADDAPDTAEEAPEPLAEVSTAETAAAVTEDTAEQVEEDVAEAEEHDAIAEDIAAVLGAAQQESAETEASEIDDDLAALAHAETEDDDSDALDAIAAELDSSLEAELAAGDAADLDAALADTPVETADQTAEVAAETPEDDTFDEDMHPAVDAFEFVGKDLDSAFEDTSDTSAYEAEAPVAPPAPEIEPARAGMVSNIAAKLQRIRDVVARNQTAENNGYSEDEHAEDVVETTMDSADRDGVDRDSDARADQLDTAFDDEADDALAAIDAALAEDAEAETEDDVFAANEADAVSTAFADMDAELEADLAEAQDTHAEDSAAGLMTDTPDAAPLQHRRVRVIKVKRADVNVAIEEGTLEEVSAAPEEITALDAEATDDVSEETREQDAVRETSTLSPEDEADLMRELAEVEAEITGALAQSEPAPDDDAEPVTDQTEAADAAEDDTADAGLTDAAEADAPEVDLAHIAAVVTADHTTSRAEEKASKRLKAAEAAVEESALDRLMAEADTHMEEPEGSSRRAAFDHLRAAVVATRDDDALSAEATGASDDDAYRTDLAKAVKPRRPKPSDTPYTGKERRASPRPAPLKLVAEQRVDTPGARTGPVRPRRVATDDMTATEATDGTSFADYASAQGAHALPDLLEAAASYLSFVEGRDQFSRPQLMTKVRQVGPQDFTREDGLRSFGQLLRAGKIEKIKGGRFTVSDEIGFRPRDRRAAG